jgi:hypothetical protein
MNKALQSELDWITTHVAYYDSLMHAESVKQNIIKRYRIRELEAEVDRLDRQLGAAQGNPQTVS